MAQSYAAQGGESINAEVLDPLEGIDGCGVRGDGSLGMSGDVHFLQIARVELLDDARVLPYSLLSSSNQWFSAYGIDLSDAGVVPQRLHLSRA